MRITYMLLFAVILCLQAENAMSQKITLQGENLSVKDYLNTIEKQSDYLFIYDAGVNVNRKVSLNLTNRSIKEVLNNLVSQLDLSYALEGSYIILSSASKKETAGILAAQQKKGVCQNWHTFFYAQGPDFHKLGLCYYLKIMYL